MNKNYNFVPILSILAIMIVAIPAAFGQGGTVGNNAIGDAYEANLNGPVQDSISTVGELDYYKFYIDSSGLAQIKVDDVPEDMLAEITLYNKNNEGAGYKAASNPGDPTTLKADLLGPGWYYIRIKDNANKAYSNPYSLTVDFEPAPDQYEPNSGIGDATSIELGNTIDAYICPVSDIDYYKVNMDGPGVLVLKVSDVPEDMLTEISLYNKNGESIGYKAASNPGDSVTLEQGVSDSGIYYLKIKDNAGKAYSLPYALIASLK